MASLVIMAAGMGSRFGGLKQAETIADGKAIVDFSVYDAIKAGFDKVVFIIREDMQDTFKALVGNRIADKVQVEYVYQDMSMLPSSRKKPFGTGHAIYCCKDIVKEPFAIINADDYYGANAFKEIHSHLENAKKGEWAMVAYHLSQTLSLNGTVSRGICEVEHGYLKKVTECTSIYPDCTCIIDNNKVVLDKDTPISMNLWGLTPDIFDILEVEYNNFLQNANLEKDELYIPSVIQDALAKGQSTVKVFKNTDKWYGITYKEDLAEIRQAIQSYIDCGLYDGI